VTAAADQLDVSRKTVHGWLRRYHEGGLAALADRSSAPRTTPHAVPDDQLAEIIALPGQHPTWDPEKLRAGSVVPSPTGDLRRRGGGGINRKPWRQ